VALGARRVDKRQQLVGRSARPKGGRGRLDVGGMTLSATLGDGVSYGASLG
jgi:hypothetical protein